MVKERERSRSGPPEKRPVPRSAYARSRRQKKSGPPAWVYIAIVAVVVVVVGGGSMSVLGQGGASGPTTASDVSSGGSTSSGNVQLPRYAYADPVALEGYQWVLTQAGQDVLKYMPCYCGCGEHGGHKNNLNCFIQDPVAGRPLVFDSHAST